MRPSDQGGLQVATLALDFIGKADLLLGFAVEYACKASNCGKNEDNDESCVGSIITFGGVIWLVDFAVLAIIIAYTVCCAFLAVSIFFDMDCTFSIFTDTEIVTIFAFITFIWLIISTLAVMDIYNRTWATSLTFWACTVEFFFAIAAFCIYCS